MTDILMDKGVQEHKDPKNCIYLLDDEDSLSQVGYKIMLSHKVPCLLNAARIRHNGQTELIYMTKGYLSYKGILPTLPRDGVFMICSKVLEAVLKVKNQGFLLCENIDASLEKVFFDPKTYEAHLVYLPLGAGDDNNEAKFEASIRHLLLQFVKQSNSIVSERERHVVDALSNGTGGGLEGLVKILSDSTQGQNATVGMNRAIRLVSMNPSLPMTCEMKGNQLKIGRKKDNDIVLDFSNQISRLHCSVTKESGLFFVQDEGSTYGTKLNGKLLKAKQPVAVNDGDVLALPRMTFKIQVM